MLDTGSYETTSYMCRRIRAATKDGIFTRLTGKVEVDETTLVARPRTATSRSVSARKSAAGTPRSP